MGVWQKQLGKMVEHRNQSHPNPGLRADGPPYAVVVIIDFTPAEGEGEPGHADEQDWRRVHPAGQAAHDAADHVGQDERRVPEAQLGGAQEVTQRTHQQGTSSIQEKCHNKQFAAIF